MQVIINPDRGVLAGSLGLLAAGSTQDLSETLARQLVGAGQARWVTPPALSQSVLDLPPAAVQALVSGDVIRGTKSPIPLLGMTDLALSDVTVLAGSPTVTLTTGPNGQPAIKIVTGAGVNCEVAVPSAVGALWGGDAYLIMDGSYSSGNLDYVTLYASQTDASYTNGVNQLLQYGFTAPQQGAYEQGGANTYFFRKSGHSNIGTPTYPINVGQFKIRIAPRSGLAATVYIYALALSAPAKKARICVGWDDGYDSMFKLGYDVFSSREIKQTVGVIASAQGTGSGFSSLAQLKAFVASGNACVAHGPRPNQGAGNLFSAYPGSANPVADAISDMNYNRDWIASNGLATNGYEKCYVWPQGQFQQSVNDLALLNAASANGYALARSTTQLTASALYGYGTNLDALTKYNKLAAPIIGHLWAGTTAAEATNISAITTLIGRLGATGTDGHLMLHRVLPTSTSDGSMGAAGSITIRRGDLETIADAIVTEIAAGRMASVTMPELAVSNQWSGY